MVFIDNSIYHAVHFLVNTFLEIIVRGITEQFAVLGDSISKFFPHISIKKGALQLLSGCASL